MRRISVNRNATCVLLTTLLTLLILSAGSLSAHVFSDTLHIRKADTTFVVRIDTLRTVELVEPEGWPGAAIRTNLLWDGIAAPNLGFDFALGRHFSLGVNAGIKPWPRWTAWDWDTQNPTKWRHFLVAPELRWWPGRVYDGWFIGADLLYAHYNLASLRLPFGLYPALRDSRLQGDAFAAGLFAGHSWWLGEHWRIELAAGVAAGYRDADRYECAHCGAQVGREQGPLIIPQFALNLAWNTRPRRTRGERLEYVHIPVDTLVQPRVVLPEPQLYFPAPVIPQIGPTELKAPEYPMLQPAGNYRPYTPDRVMRKEPGARYVYFIPGESRLRRVFDYFERHRDNGPVLDEILASTRAVLADSTCRISRIQIIGFASIEGDPARNKRLAQSRALALQHFVQEQLDVPDDAFDIACGAEAWSEFRDQIQDLILDGGGDDLTVEELRDVLDIIDNEPDPVRREQRLLRLRRGTVYPKLARGILQDQRNAGYVHIYFDAAPDAAAQAINGAIAKMERGEYAAALQQVEPWRNDPRSTRALAAALYYNGRETEAYALLRSAVGAGDDDAAKDLVELQALTGQRAAYEAYLRERENINK